MYAVIETGGKQYRVEYGKELHVELLRFADLVVQSFGQRSCMSHWRPTDSMAA